MLACLTWGAGAPLGAATIPYATDGDLVARAARVVHARVVVSRATRGPGGVIQTATELLVIEDLTGIVEERFEVVEVGGTLAATTLVVPGTPRFVAGEEVVVCLERGPRGEWRNVALSFSTFVVARVQSEARAVAGDLLEREPTGAHVIGRPSQEPPPATLAEFRRLVSAIKGRRSWRSPFVHRDRPAPRQQTDPVLVPEAATPTHFTLLGSGVRWAEADRGIPILWYRNSDAPAPVVGGNGDAEIRLALAAWTLPSTGSIELRYAGERLLGSASPFCGSGNTGSGLVSFEDPSGTMASNVLALGGGCLASSDQRTVNGVAFQSFSHAFVVFNRAAAVSATYRTPTNFARILEHEIGHGIGLGHTDAGASQAVANIMFASCCYGPTPAPPALGPDDLAGLEFIYPAAMALSCSFSVAPLAAAFPAGGGMASVSVATAPACSWSAESLVSWIRLTQGASRHGTGDVPYVVAANLGPPRHGHLQIAGQEITVTQGSDDTDGDGLPDSWEKQFGLNPNSASGADGSSGDPDGDGRSNADEYRRNGHPRGVFKQLFAEGTASAFFDIRFAVFNPNDEAAQVLAHAMSASGAETTVAFQLPRRSRKTLVPATDLGWHQAEFALTFESSIPIVADRTMMWDSTKYGAHAETGVPTAASRWYFAEGATHSGFELFYLIANPNDRDVSVRVRYLLPDSQAALERSYDVAARSRRTVWVNIEDPRLEATDVAAIVTAAEDQSIVVERAMYLSRRGELFAAGHASAGATAPASRWWFAEGATGSFFDSFLLVANPGVRDAPLEVTYWLPSGDRVVVPHLVPAESRRTIWLDADDPRIDNSAVAIEVRSLDHVPVVAERAMWWPGPTASEWEEAHVGVGLSQTAGRWALPSVDTGGPLDVRSFILVANASETAGTVSVALSCEDALAAPATRTFRMAATSRLNVDVAREFPGGAGRACSALIDGSALQLIVERASYWSARGQFWAAGVASRGGDVP
jgi:hypothetical protein